MNSHEKKREKNLDDDAEELFHEWFIEVDIKENFIIFQL
jgi:hypothetical protein